MLVVQSGLIESVCLKISQETNPAWQRKHRNGIYITKWMDNKAVMFGSKLPQLLEKIKIERQQQSILLMSEVDGRQNTTGIEFCRVESCCVESSLFELCGKQGRRRVDTHDDDHPLRYANIFHEVEYKNKKKYCYYCYNVRNKQLVKTYYSCKTDIYLFI